MAELQEAVCYPSVLGRHAAGQQFAAADALRERGSALAPLNSRQQGKLGVRFAVGS